MNVNVHSQTSQYKQTVSGNSSTLHQQRKMLMVCFNLMGVKFGFGKTGFMGTYVLLIVLRCADMSELIYYIYLHFMISSGIDGKAEDLNLSTSDVEIPDSKHTTMMDLVRKMTSLNQ